MKRLEKLTEYKKMSLEALQGELIALLREQFSLRMQRSAGQFTKHHLFNLGRRNIARIKTLITQKMLEGEKA